MRTLILFNLMISSVTCVIAKSTNQIKIEVLPKDQPDDNNPYLFACSSDSQCNSTFCNKAGGNNPEYWVCGCYEAGDGCTTDSYCCSNICSNGVCVGTGTQGMYCYVPGGGDTCAPGCTCKPWGGDGNGYCDGCGTIPSTSNKPITTVATNNNPYLFACSSDSQCNSTYCDKAGGDNPEYWVCHCYEAGDGCTTDSYCCSNICSNGVCVGTGTQGMVCSLDGDGDFCAPGCTCKQWGGDYHGYCDGCGTIPSTSNKPITTVATNNNPYLFACSSDTQCNSTYCDKAGGNNPEYWVCHCYEAGDRCTTDSYCCSNICSNGVCVGTGTQGMYCYVPGDGDTCAPGCTCKPWGGDYHGYCDGCGAIPSSSNRPITSVATNYCSSSPCKNGATCISQNHGYKCQCSAGYSGKTCQNAKIVTCHANGDPHFTTFDGAYYSPQEPPGPWFLAAQLTNVPAGTLPWAVWFSTQYYYGNHKATCIVNVEIDIAGQVVEFGMFGFLRVNGINRVAPWYYPNKENAEVSVFNNGWYGHTLGTKDLITVSFSGATDYSMKIQAPYHVYTNDTEGVCGNMNGNRHDDPICPGGGSINTCWQRHHSQSTTVQPTTLRTTSQFHTSAIPPVTTTEFSPNCGEESQQEIDEECSIVLNSTGPFGACVTDASELALNYYNSCIFDMCVANQSDALCSLLQSYADACMQVIPNLQLQWRTAEFCSPNCPVNSHYLDCASSCPATCSNPWITACFSSPCQGSCICDSGYVFDGGNCILPKYCGCLDSDGYYHQYGSNWVMNDCTENCTCMENHTTYCASKRACDIHGACTPHDGDESCKCLPGYTGDGEICTSLSTTPKHTFTTQSSGNSTTASNFNCNGKVDGDYPDPTNPCSSVWYKCAHGVAYPQLCPENTVFDSQLDQCVWPYQLPVCSVTTRLPPTTTHPETVETCRASGDPHFTTFDGAYYSPQPPPGPWFLAAKPLEWSEEIQHWSVWFSTMACSSTVTCIVKLQIIIEGQIVDFGMNGFLQINNLNVIAPWYYPNKDNASLWVMNYGSTGHTLSTTDHVSITFSGSTDYSMTVQVPREIYFNDTEGFCGNMNDNPNDDPICPDGEPINTCWERHHRKTTMGPFTTQKYTGSTLAVTTSANLLCDPQTQQLVDQECSIITDPSGPFSACAANDSSLASNYYSSCTFDLCAYNNPPGAICQVLQSYADACMQNLPDVILSWRSAGLCPPNCSANMHYEDCSPSCPATCSDPNGPLHCSLPCRGGCECDSGYFLDNGQCVQSDKCGCVDPDGYYHQIGSQWLYEDCQMLCMCSSNQSIVCVQTTPCDTHAACVAQDGQDGCYCLPGYTGNGLQCSPIDYCVNDPCENGGTCVNEQFSYECRCSSGYDGKNCENKLLTTATFEPTSTVSGNFNCNGKVDGDYPDPTNPCSSVWYKCAHGVAYPQLCPENTVFDSQLDQCVWPYQLPVCSVTTRLPPTTTHPETVETCRASGDPHFTTFDGAYYSPQPPPGPWFLAAKPLEWSEEIQHWSVWFSTMACSSTVTCIVKLQIIIEGQIVDFGMNGFLQINNLNVIAPWYYPNKDNASLWVMNYGSTGHTLSTTDHVSITFSGSTDYSMTVQVPREIYFNDTEGFCGNMNDNPNDDPICPDGEPINTCWERHHRKTTMGPFTTQKYTGSTLAVTTSANLLCDPQTQQLVDQECSIITDPSGPFSACAANDSSLASNYYSSCTFDLCAYNNPPGAICQVLQSYADACMQNLPDVILSWRSAGLCPPNCSANMHYEDCSPSCPATCSDPNGPLHCSLPCRGGCECDSGYFLDNGQCVQSDKCGCVDPDGYYHQIGSQWLYEDCQMLCMCSSNQSIVCVQTTPCDTHAACVAQDGQDGCYCLPGYTGNGLQCSPIDYCVNDPCENGGTCVNEQFSYECRCSSGYDGKNCENKLLTTATFEPTSTVSGNFNCNGKVDGDYPDPTNPCSSVWYKCAHGVAYPQLCPENTVFDSQLDQCVWPYQLPVCSVTTRLPPTTTHPETVETCRASGDPHFTTFDGAYYSPQPPPGPWFLAAKPLEWSEEIQHWSVWFSTMACSSTVTCIVKLQIIIEGQIVDFGMNGFLQINNLNVIAPWYYPNKDNASLWVMNYGSTGHTLSTTDHVSITFSGSTDYSMTVQVPREIYFNDTEGFCGNMNDNPNDDPICPDGEPINTCWERHHRKTTMGPFTTQKYTGSTLAVTTSANLLCDPQTQQLVDQECSIITDPSGPFSACAANDSSLASNYYSSCTFDLCAYNNPPGAICQVLQSYADACMQNLPDVILSWRSAGLCPPNCSANMHYEDCSPSCPATCSDPNGPLHCSLPCRGGCECDSGYFLDNGQCVQSDKCGCVDPDGYYHQIGSQWLYEDCQMLCMCSSNQSIVCVQTTPCDTHAACVAQDGQDGCYCLPGYTGNGLQCSPIDYCVNDPCENGGTCVNEQFSYECRCSSGYDGKNCENKLLTTATFEPTSTVSGNFNCNGKVDGDYPDPTNPCSSVWYKCAHGVAYPQLCPENTVFDSQLDQCVWPYQLPVCSVTTRLPPTTTHPETVETCRASGDPHFTTFDGAYYSPQPPPGPWFLAAKPLEWSEEIQHWSVWFSTMACSSTVTCIVKLQIIIEGQIVDFGMNGFLQINNLNVIAPWYYPNKDNASLWVMNYGSTGHTLSTTDHVSITFSGSTDYSMTVQVPREIYFNDTEGFCGNMNDNPNDDPICPDGEPINTCWERHHRKTTMGPFTTQKYTGSTLAVTTSANLLCDPQTQQLVDQECSIITDPSGPFSACAANDSSLASNYYSSCTFDLCAYNNPPGAICQVLQSYADACMQNLPDVILSWRSAGLCPPNCSANMHYEDCSPSCPATCSDPNGPLHCSLPCRGGCECDSGYFLDNGQCVQSDKCGCVDPDGYYHQIGSQWLYEDCQMLCMCSSNQSIVCVQTTPCDTHAACVAQDGQDGCYCLPGYTGNGLQCSPIDYCVNDPCENGGTCVNEQFSYECRCSSGYDGKNCENKLLTTATFEPTSTVSGNFNCNGKVDGDYPDPTNPCSSVWYKCAHGVAYPQLCPENTVFDSQLDQCVWPYQLPVCSVTTRLPPTTTHPETVETCRASGDPHFTTFDGAYYSPQPPPGPWFLAAKPLEWSEEIQHWSVWFSTMACSSTVTCIVKLQIIIEGQIVDFGMNGFLQINNLNVIAPWYYPNKDNASLWVMNYGSTGHTLSTTDHVSITFSGSTDYSMTVQVPREIYFNDTEGFCGNMNDNPNDDPICPDGEPINTCWERHHRKTTMGPFTTQKYTGSTLAVTTSANLLCDPQTQQLVDQECSIITDPSGPFSACAANDSSLASNYYSSCTFDLCAYNNPPGAICQVLQSYADACMQNLPDVILSWRSAGLCPPNCSANMHYEDCSPSCPATCSDPNGPLHCSLPCRGGCECDSGYFLDNGQCVQSDKCGCVDPDGYYHQIGSQWLYEDCQMLCMCSSNQSIVCVQTTPCDTHAACVAQDGQDGCYCLPGYTGNGLQCSPIDYCVNDPCENGGTCVNEQFSYECRCSSGYDGKNCENKLLTTATFEPTSTVSVSFDCQDKQDGNYPDPNNPCSHYFWYCSNGVAYRMECPGNLVYDAYDNHCTYPENLPACNNETSTTPTRFTPVTTSSSAVNYNCTSKPDGNYVDPDNPCSHYYYTCTDGEASKSECPGNYVFDPEEDGCTAESYVPACQGSTVFTAFVSSEPQTSQSMRISSTNSALSASTTGCTTSIAFDCKMLGDGDYVHPTNPCSSWYLRCTFGYARALNCPQDLYFDVRSSRCLDKRLVPACF